MTYTVQPWHAVLSHKIIKTCLSLSLDSSYKYSREEQTSDIDSSYSENAVFQVQQVVLVSPKGLVFQFLATLRSHRKLKVFDKQE